MNAKLESHGGIKDGADRRKRGIDDRGKHMDRAVEDKKKIADISHKLRLSTTQEGAEQIKHAIRKAVEATHQEFKRQNVDIEKKFVECNKAEEDLRHRTKSAKLDAADAKKALSKIKEAKGARNPIHQAEKASDSDARFTNEQREKQKGHRVKSEKHRNEQRTQLINTKLSW